MATQLRELGEGAANKMAKKTKKIDVQGSEITILTNEEQDYISLTDMVRDIENGSALIEKWLRNKNSIEFLGIWEEIYNPDFNSLEFEGIKNQAGLNRFILSVKQWVDKTNRKRICLIWHYLERRPPSGEPKTLTKQGISAIMPMFHN